MTTVVSTADSLARVLGGTAGIDSASKDARGRRAVVMTMGALHSGHLALVRRARELAEQVVVTIFVNPLQFGPGEDFERYPRTLEADVALLDSAGVDVVFAPELEEMYPGGSPRVIVDTGRLGTVLEGASRPGHFDGVATVVLKLMHLTRADIAVFGEKDAQQLLVVRRMVHDLDVPVEVVGVPVERGPDGLALSSRNSYLTEEQRAQALALPGALQAGESAGGRGTQAVQRAAEAVLTQAPGVELDYLVVVDPTTVEPVGPDYRGTALLLVAARVGGVRLIDNVAVEMGRGDCVPRPGGQT